MNFLIPKHMDGEQSKLAAKIVMLERDIELAKAKLFGAKNRWNKLYVESQAVGWLSLFAKQMEPIIGLRIETAAFLHVLYYEKA